ncbi:MAG: ester cyclase [Pseudohongiellaceae bacterium]
MTAPTPIPDQIATVLRNKKLTQDFWIQVLNGANYDLIDTTLAPTYTYNGHPSKASGTKIWLQGLHAMAPDLYFRIESLSGANDTVIIRWTLTATVTGKFGMLTGENVLVWNADGQCVSNWQSMGTPAYVHEIS